MAKICQRLLVTVILTIINLALFAQDTTNGSTLNATMRSHNKIYVVMAVCITILIGLILYLIRIDRKVSRLERGVL